MFQYYGGARMPNVSAFQRMTYSGQARTHPPRDAIPGALALVEHRHLVPLRLEPNLGQVHLADLGVDLVERL